MSLTVNGTDNVSPTWKIKRAERKTKFEEDEDTAPAQQLCMEVKQ